MVHLRQAVAGTNNLQGAHNVSARDSIRGPIAEREPFIGFRRTCRIGRAAID
jgi:hypothetical protein